MDRYQIIYTEQYNKRAARFLKKHPQIQKQYEKTLLLLERNPGHPSLRLHQLSNKLQGIHSISINIRYRIMLELLLVDKKIILLDIGGHDLYN